MLIKTCDLRGAKVFLRVANAPLPVPTLKETLDRKDS